MKRGGTPPEIQEKTQSEYSRLGSEEKVLIEKARMIAKFLASKFPERENPPVIGITEYLKKKIEKWPNHFSGTVIKFLVEGIKVEGIKEEENYEEYWEEYRKKSKEIDKILGGRNIEII